MNKSTRNFPFALSSFVLAATATAAFSTPSPCTGSPANPEAQHALTCLEVIEDLIWSGKDGSLQRLNDTIYQRS